MSSPRLHAQAFDDALRRIASQRLATAISVAVIGIALAVPVVAGMLLASLAAATAQLDTDPHVNIYLALQASDEDVKRLEKALRSDPDAAAVRFIPRAQALEELKATTHLADLLSSLDRNPLPHAFTVRLRAGDPEQLRSARARWAALPGVDQAAADFEWAEKIGRWRIFGERLVGAAALLLGLAVLFIVGHLIRLQVLTRRDEIEVSQLIGATAADVRRPFLYHGALQGLLAGLAAIAIAAAIAAWLSGELQALAPSYASDFKIIFITPAMAGLISATTALLGLAGAWIGVARELRAFAASHR